MYLYRTLKRMIERGQTEGIESKLDIFYAANKITEEQYLELMAMLTPDEVEAESEVVAENTDEPAE